MRQDKGPIMEISGTSYLATPSGIKEHTFDTKLGKNFWIICDPLGQEHPTPSYLIEKIEHTLSDFLAHLPINEGTVSVAFEKAHHLLLEHPTTSLSLLLVAKTPPCPNTGTQEILFATAGDLRVYEAFGNLLSLVFCHPQALSIPSNLSTEERYHRLSSALGHSTTPQPYIRKLPQDTVHRYLIASYGLYAHSTHEELLAMALHPSDLDRGIAAKLHTTPTHGHSIQATALLCDALDSPAAAPIKSQSLLPHATRKRQKTALALTGTAAAVLAILATQWQSPPSPNILPETSETALLEGQEALLLPLEHATTGALLHRQEIDKLQERLAEASEREQELIAQMSALLTAIPTSHEFARSWAQEKEALQHRIASLQNLHEEALQELASSRHTLQETKQEILAKNDLLNELQNNLAAIQGDAGDSIAALQKEIYALQSTHQELLDAMAREKENYHQRELSLASLIEAQKEELLKEKALLEGNNAILLAENERLHSENTLTKGSLKASQQQHTESILSYQRVCQDFAALEKDLQIAQAENHRLHTTLAMTQDLHKEAQRRYQEASKMLHAYKATPQEPPATPVISIEAPTAIAAATESKAALETIKAAARVHIVDRGETLSMISQKYYGSPNFWKVIYNANKDHIDNANKLRVGTPLQIPD